MTHRSRWPDRSLRASLGLIVQQPLPFRRLALRGTLSAQWHTVRGCVFVGSVCVDQHRITRIGSADIASVGRLSPPEAHWSPYLVLGGVSHTYDSNFPDNLPPSHPQRIGSLFGVGCDVRRDRVTYFGEWRRLSAPPGALAQFNIGGRLTVGSAPHRARVRGDPFHTALRFEKWIAPGVSLSDEVRDDDAHELTRPCGAAEVGDGWRDCYPSEAPSRSVQFSLVILSNFIPVTIAPKDLPLENGRRAGWQLFPERRGTVWFASQTT